MKKILKYIILVFLAITWVSCSDDFIDPNKDKPIVLSDKIKFFANQDNTGNNTKGTELTNINFTKFNIFAYTSSSLLSTSPTMTSFINNLTVTKTGNIWNYAGNHYWPESGYVHFYGVATDGTNAGLPTGITNWSPPNAQGYPKFSFQIQNTVGGVKDLVTAKTTDRNKFINPGNVVLSFHHVLAKFRINIDSWYYGQQLKIQKITVKNIIKKGDYTYNLNKGEWSFPDTTKTSIIYWQGNQNIWNKDNHTFDEDFFIIPNNGVIVVLDFLSCPNKVFASVNTTAHTVSFTLSNLNIGDNKLFRLKLE